jgi:hypothetical protein
LFADSPDAEDKSVVGEGSWELDSEEAEGVSARVADSRGVAEGEVSAAGEFSGAGDRDVSEGPFGWFAGEASGVAEEIGRAIEISRL